MYLPTYLNTCNSGRFQFVTNTVKYCKESCRLATSTKTAKTFRESNREATKTMNNNNTEEFGLEK